MRRAVTRLGLVGLLAGGLVAASAGAALAKSDVQLTTRQQVARPGAVIVFAGSADDDAGIHKALFCLQERTTTRRWVRVGHCVRSHRESQWSAGFTLKDQVFYRGRHEFRAVGLNPVTLVERYGPSPAVIVTVR